MIQEPTKSGSVFGPKVENRLRPSSLPFVCTRNVENYVLSAYPSYIDVNTSAHFLRTEAWKQSSYFDSNYPDLVPRTLLYNTLVEDAIQRRLCDYRKAPGSSLSSSTSTDSPSSSSSSSSSRLHCSACITSCTHDGEDYIVYATGIKLSRIRIQSFQSAFLSTFSTHQVHEKQFSNRIHEVRCIGRCGNGRPKENSYILVHSCTELTYFTTARDHVNGQVKLQLLKSYRFQAGIRCMNSTDIYNQYSPMSMLIGYDDCMYKWLPDQGFKKHSDLSSVILENNRDDITNCYLELSNHPQISYFALNTAIYTVDNRLYTSQPVQLFKLMKPIGSLLQHKTSSNYLFASIVGQLNVLDVRFPRHTFAQRPIPYTHDRMKFHSVGSKAIDVIMGYARDSQHITLHSLCIKSFENENEVDLTNTQNIQSLATTSIFSCVSQPTMTAVALDSSSFPVIDNAHPYNATLIGAELSAIKKRLNVIEENGESDRSSKDYDRTFLFHQSCIGDVYAQELHISNCKSSIHDGLPCGVGANTTFYRDISADEGVSLSDYDICDDNLNKYPLSSNNILPIVEGFNIRKFDVLEITPSNLRLPRYIPRYNEKNKIDKVVTRSKTEGLPQKEKAKKTERKMKCERRMKSSEKKKVKVAAQEAYQKRFEEFTKKFIEAQRKREEIKKLKEARRKKEDAAKRNIKSGTNCTGLSKTKKIPSSFIFEDIADATTEINIPITGKSNENAGSFDSAGTLYMNVGNEEEKYQGKEDEEKVEKDAENEKEVLFQVNSFPQDTTEGNIGEDLGLKNSEPVNYEHSQDDDQTSNDVISLTLSTQVHKELNILETENILNNAVDKLLVEMKAIAGVAEDKKASKCSLNSFHSSRESMKEYRAKMTLWEIWYFVVGVHVRKVKKRCDVDINKLREVLLRDFEESLTSSLPIDQFEFANRNRVLSSDGYYVYQQCADIGCSCLQKLSQNKTSIKDLLICGKRDCLAPHHLLYSPVDKATDLKGTQDNGDKDVRGVSCGGLKNIVQAESDVTNDVIQQLQEAWPAEI